MKIPTLKQAEAFLAEAERLNPGPWIQHSIYVAKAASIIAELHPKLDKDVAFILGYLHDIGRRYGVTDMRHTLDGYLFLQEQGYPDAARVCITHSFPVLRRDWMAGRWDCTEEETLFVERYLEQIELDEYDGLIQLCDALALPTGFTIIEKRFIDVALRRGVHANTVIGWRAYFALKERFEEAIGRPLYSILPSIVENTFGFANGAT